MPKWIPERPVYKRERRTVSLLALITFLLLLTSRLLTHLLPFGHKLWLVAPVLSGVSFLLPVGGYILFRKRGYIQSMRFQLPRAAHIPLLLFAFSALFCGSFLLSMLTGGLDTLGNSVSAFSQNNTETVWQLLLSLVSVGILPAFLEELCFRGIVATEYERRGAYRAILMSALLFALIHFDIANFLAYLYAGVLLVLVLFATNSLLATLLLHISYQVASLLAHRYLVALYRFTGTVQLFLFILIVLLLLALILFCRSSMRIYRNRDEHGISNPRRDVPYNVQFYTVLDALSDPAFILCVIVSIVGFILF